MNESRTAQFFAQKLLAQAVGNEQRITADLQIIARKVFAEIVGSEYKFKSQESLIRKLIVLAETNFIELRQVSESVNDVLRYMFILEFENYAKGFYKTIEERPAKI